MKEQQNKPLQKQDSELTRAKRRVAVQVVSIVVVSLTVCAILFGLTSAWYTNIVKQNEITVQTADWGVNVTITYADPGEDDRYELVKDEKGDVISVSFRDMYPGSVVDIPITITNNGELPARVRVDISREGMDARMLQRLFFYTGDSADTGTYFTSKEPKVYEIPAKAGGSTANVVNDTIHCVWVKDVVGYFLEAEVTQREEWLSDKGEYEYTYPSINVSEYLRPPVYFDPAAAYYDPSTGELANIYGYTDGRSDGSLGIYLTGLGVAEGDKLPGSGFYKIRVTQGESTNSGNTTLTQYTGAWFYLCTSSDIAEATQYDTSLGEDALEKLNDGDPETKPAAFTARITFTGEVGEESSGG